MRWKALKTPLDPRKTPSTGQVKTGRYLKTETPQELKGMLHVPRAAQALLPLPKSIDNYPMHWIAMHVYVC